MRAPPCDSDSFSLKRARRETFFTPRVSCGAISRVNEGTEASVGAHILVLLSMRACSGVLLRARSTCRVWISLAFQNLISFTEPPTLLSGHWKVLDFDACFVNWIVVIRRCALVLDLLQLFSSRSRLGAHRWPVIGL